MTLARTTSVPTPTLDRLLQYCNPDTPQVPDGIAEIPLRWGGLFLALGALAMLVTGSVHLALRLFDTKRR